MDIIFTESLGDVLQELTTEEIGFLVLAAYATIHTELAENINLEGEPTNNPAYRIAKRQLLRETREYAETDEE